VERSNAGHGRTFLAFSVADKDNTTGWMTAAQVAVGLSRFSDKVVKRKPILFERMGILFLG